MLLVDTMRRLVSIIESSGKCAGAREERETYGKVKVPELGTDQRRRDMNKPGNINNIVHTNHAIKSSIEIQGSRDDTKMTYYAVNPA